MFNVYSQPKDGMFAKTQPANDAMKAFHMAREEFKATGQRACVVDTANMSIDIFQISDRGETVSAKYADEWATETCTHCDGTGKISDGYDAMPCRFCR